MKLTNTFALSVVIGIAWAIATIGLLFITAAPSFAGDSSFSSNLSGTFGGHTESHAANQGASFSGGVAALGSHGMSRMSNESGASSFSGAATTHTFDGGNKGGMTVTSETFSEGADFSKTSAYDSGNGTAAIGGTFSTRSGDASAFSSFEGGFGQGGQGGSGHGGGNGCLFFCVN